MGLLQLPVFGEEAELSWLGSPLERPSEVSPMAARAGGAQGLAPALWGRQGPERAGRCREGFHHAHIRPHGGQPTWAGVATGAPPPAIPGPS